jgi:hypothetical protein
MYSHFIPADSMVVYHARTTAIRLAALIFDTLNVRPWSSNPGHIAEMLAHRGIRRILLDLEAESVDQLDRSSIELIEGLKKASRRLNVAVGELSRFPALVAEMTGEDVAQIAKKYGRSVRYASYSKSQYTSLSESLRPFMSDSGGATQFKGDDPTLDGGIKRSLQLALHFHCILEQQDLAQLFSIWLRDLDESYLSSPDPFCLSTKYRELDTKLLGFISSCETFVNAVAVLTGINIPKLWHEVQACGQVSEVNRFEIVPFGRRGQRDAAEGLGRFEHEDVEF